MAADDQHVAVAQAARAVERLAVQLGAVAAVEVGRHQHAAAALDLEVVPGDRLVVDVDVGLGIAADDRALAAERHRAGLAVAPVSQMRASMSPPSIESRPVTDADAEKRLAAEAAAELVEDGMTVGLGTGSTVAHLLPAIAARGLERDPLRRHLGRHRGAGA